MSAPISHRRTMRRSVLTFGHAVLYRLSVFLLALAAAGAALALRPVAALAALALGIASPCLVVAGSARCRRRRSRQKPRREFLVRKVRPVRSYLLVFHLYFLPPTFRRRNQQANQCWMKKASSLRCKRPKTFIAVIREQ